MPRTILPYLCEHCGENDPKQFRNRYKQRCKKCQATYAREWQSKQGPDYHKAENARKVAWQLNHPFQYAAINARSRATKKKLPCEITGQYLERLYEEQEGLCYYTGQPMLINSKCDVRSFSVDRIDSSIGYTKDNVVLCRTAINRMKNSHNLDDFIKWCRQVAAHSPE